MSYIYSRQDRRVSDEIVMEATGINKSFPGVKALTDVDINIRKGEVVALLGDGAATGGMVYEGLSDAAESSASGSTRFIILEVSVTSRAQLCASLAPISQSP